MGENRGEVLTVSFLNLGLVCGINYDGFKGEIILDLWVTGRSCIECMLDAGSTIGLD